MANRIKLAGTTSTSFQIGLQKVTLDTTQISSPYTLNLPSGTGTANQILKTDGSGNLSWTTEYSYTLPTASTTVLGGVKVDNSTITINGSGVIQANYSTTLAGLTDTAVSTPLNNQVLTYNTATSKWVPTTVNGVNVPVTGIAYYGNFYDTTTQNASSATTAYPININHGSGNGVVISSSNRITFTYGGNYEVQYSIQFVNTDTKSSSVQIWARLNGTDVADSNSLFVVPSKQNSNGALIAVSPLLFENLSAGDYVQIMWQCDNSSTTISTIAPGTTPTTPEIPGVIVLVQPVASMVVPTTVTTLTATGNITANNFVPGVTQIVTAAGTTNLTAASPRNIILTGTSTQNIVLPDATTLTVGIGFFINNNSTGNVTIKDNSGTTLYTLPGGASIEPVCTSVSASAGSWDGHGFLPDTISWGDSSLTFTNGTINTGKIVASSATGSSFKNTNSAGGTTFTITGTPFLPVGDQVWAFKTGQSLGAPASWMSWPDGSIQLSAWTGSSPTLTTPRAINGVNFDGSADITITAAAGTLTGTTLNSSVVTSSLTSVGTLANLTVTNTITGSVSGNAGTATKLATARAINGVNFDGSAAITVTADASTLTGTTLKSTVVNSSLTSVGTLTSLTSAGTVTFTDTTNSSNTTTGALQVRGGVGVAGNIYLGGGINATGSIYSAGVNVTYAPVTPTGQAFQATGKDTLGGTGYFDFFKATNTTSGVTNGSKTMRLNSVGTLEILNNAYNATILSVTDAGFIAINAASGVSNGVPANNAIAMNSNSYIYDDGNYHLTSKAGSVWINANDGSAVNINTQMPSGITGGGLNVQGAVKSYGAGGAATAFISSGSNVVSGVALQLDSGTAGTAAQMAIRDTSTVSSTMYFDVSTGGSAHGSFQFRSSNAFTQLMALSNSQVSINKQTLFGGGSFGAYVTITGTNSYNLGGPYGYLSSGGAGSVGGGGASGTVGWSLQCNGRIQTNEIDATSDERLKDIQGTIPLDRALQFVRAVNGILYTWKPGFGDEGLKSGFGAQSVHKAGFDHMVAPIPNERVEGSTDADGFTSPDKFQLTLNYMEAIPYHHEVIKHLLDKVEKLEAMVAKLAKNG